MRGTSSFRALSIVLVLAGASCARLGYETVSPDANTALDASTRDGETAADTPTDLDVSPASRPSLCGFAAGQWHFETALLTAASSTTGEGEPRLSWDGLSLFFVRYGVGTFVLRRARTADSFTGTPVAVIGPVGTDVGFTPSPSGEQAWTSHIPDRGSPRHDIFRMLRTVASPLTYALDREETALNTLEEEYDPILSRDQKRIYFVTPRGALGQEIYTASRADTTALFGVPSAVEGLSSSAHEDNPSFTEDETVVLFGRVDPASNVQKDLWIAQRSTRTSAFGAAAPLTEINTPRAETESFLRPDGCELFYAVNTENGNDLELYRAVAVSGPPR